MLHISIELECAQKLFELQMMRKLCLLPSICKSTTAAPARTLPQPRTMQPPVDEAPPPYEEVETSNGHRLASFMTAVTPESTPASLLGNAVLQVG